MKFWKLNIYTSEFGMNKVTQILDIKGLSASEIEKETAEIIVGKYVVRIKNDEHVVTGYFADNEESLKLISELKVLCMMLKSKEQYGDFGWDVTTGRLYAEDITVDETNWDEL